MNSTACISNRLQFSVQKVLELHFLKTVFDLLRRKCRFYRKSSVATSYLKSTFKFTKDFTQPLRPSVGVCARRGSTLSMSKRYIYIDSILQTAHDKILRDKVRYGESGTADSLTSQQRISL